MAIPFLSDIRLPSSGKVYLWTGHNDNFLKYDLWQASASAGMTIKNIASSGNIYLQTNSITALTLDSSQNVIAANAFTGKLQGAVAGAPDSTIWRVSGQYTNWGIFYNEGSPDKIEFKAGGTVTSTIALDNGDATFNNITASGAVSAEDNIYLTDAGTIRAKLLLNASDRDNVELRAESLGSTMKFFTVGTEVLELDASQNATFAGDVTIGALTSGETAQLVVNQEGGVAPVAKFMSRTNKAIVQVSDNDTTGYVSSENGLFSLGRNPGVNANNINIDSSNRVGIGASNVQEKLHVYNAGTARIEIEGTNGPAAFKATNNQGSFGWYIPSDADNFRLWNFGTSADLVTVDASGNTTFAGTVTSPKTFISTSVGTGNPTPATDNVRFNGYGMIGNRGNLYVTNSNSSGVVQIGIGGAHNGNPKLTIGGSTSHIRTNLLPGADSTYNIGSNASRFSNIYADTLHGTVALSSEASNLGSFDDRDMAPEDMSFSDDLKLFFVEKSGIEGGTVGSNWQDALFISSYVDSSGGNPNLLTFDKSEKKIYHYQASATATSWGTPKELAYTSDFVKRTGGTSTSMSGDLHIIAGAPKIYLQDNTDDDDQQIVFRNNGGSDEYKIATQDFTSAGTGDGLFIGSETTDPVKLVTNDTIALAIDSSQHVSLPGAYLTLKDINSHAQIEASSSSLMLKAVNIQTQGNLIPDGTGNRSLGASNRYWSETYTNGVTSGGNIVINSNTPILTLGVINSSTGNSKIQFYSKNSGAANGYALQYNKDTNIDRLEFIDGSGNANIKFINGGAAEFAGSVTASTINTGQGATEVHLMNQNLRTTDDVTFDNLTVTGNISVTGDLNTVSVTDLDVSDKTITVGVGQDEGHSGGSGLKVSGPSTQPSILWDEGNDTWDFNYGINVGGHIELDSNKAVIFDNTNNNNAWYIRNGGSNAATLQFGLGASPGSNIKHTFEGNGAVSFATYVSAATGFRMPSGQAIDFIDSNIGYNSIERNTTVGGLQINTGDTASMNILDDGKVGIGTNSPSELLEISGTGELSAKINNTQYSRSFTITQGGGYSHLKTSHSSGVAINYGQGNVGILSLFNNTTQVTKINANGDSYFNGGNVGIGTTSPFGAATNRTAFSVNGTSDVTLNIGTGGTQRGYMYSDGTQTRVATVGAIPLTLGVNDTEKMRITNSGNVGIGITVPTAELHVEGNLELGSNWQVGSNSGSYWQRIRTVDSSSETAQAFNFETRNGSGSFITHATILNNGNVGVGIAPVAKLHVYQNDTADDTTAGVTIEQDGTGDAALSFLLTSVRRWRLGIDNNDADKFKISSATNLATNNKLTIDVDGKVGIGTTTPGDMLHIHATGNGNKALIIEDDARRLELGRDQIVAKSADGSTVQNLYINPSGTTAFAINSGAVGIGIALPTNPLHVKNGDSSGGNTYSLIKVENGTNHAEFGTLSGYARIRAAGNEIMAGSWGATYFYNSGVTGLTLTGNKTGVGTTSPTYKLSVAGAISGAGFVTYTKSYASLNSTGNAVAGITASANGNGSSCGFTFTCFGGAGKYQKVVYSCYNDQGTWRTRKVIDEGTNDLDVAASADGSTITFTFRATSSNQGYTPRVKVEAEGHNINSTYA